MQVHNKPIYGTYRPTASAFIPQVSTFWLWLCLWFGSFFSLHFLELMLSFGFITKYKQWEMEKRKYVDICMFRCFAAMYAHMWIKKTVGKLLENLLVWYFGRCTTCAVAYTVRAFQYMLVAISSFFIHVNSIQWSTPGLRFVLPLICCIAETSN